MSIANLGLIWSKNAVKMVWGSCDSLVDGCPSSGEKPISMAWLPFAGLIGLRTRRRCSRTVAKLCCGLSLMTRTGSLALSLPRPPALQPNAVGRMKHFSRQLLVVWLFLFRYVLAFANLDTREVAWNGLSPCAVSAATQSSYSPLMSSGQMLGADLFSRGMSTHGHKLSMR